MVGIMPAWQSLAYILYLWQILAYFLKSTCNLWNTQMGSAMVPGSSIASYLLQPRQVVSLGASGAVFGLFVVSVLCKLSLNPRKLLECAILGQFVLQQVLHVSPHVQDILFGEGQKGDDAWTSQPLCKKSQCLGVLWGAQDVFLSYPPSNLHLWHKQASEEHWPSWREFQLLFVLYTLELLDSPWNH